MNEGRREGKKEEQIGKCKKKNFKSKRIQNAKNKNKRKKKMKEKWFKEGKKERKKERKKKKRMNT